jgi:hypothetical protein
MKGENIFQTIGSILTKNIRLDLGISCYERKFVESNMKSLIFLKH